MNNKKEALFAHLMSDFVNGCPDLQVAAAMFATDHRYLINEKFKLFLDFISILAMQYEQGDYDPRNEFACRQSHAFMTLYGEGERLKSLDEVMTKHLESARYALDSYRPYKERQQEDVTLTDQVMFAISDFKSMNATFRRMLFRCIFGDDMGRHLYSHYSEEKPWDFWFTLDTENRYKFLSYIKSRPAYQETARKKLQTSNLNER